LIFRRSRHQTGQWFRQLLWDSWGLA